MILNTTFLQINKMWTMIEKFKPTLKTISENNYIKNFKRKYKIKYEKINNGLCTLNNKKIFTTRYLLKNNYVSKSQCDKKTRKDISHAYTFTNKNTAKKKKLKYNCLIHRIHNIKDVIKIHLYLCHFKIIKVTKQIQLKFLRVLRQ